MNDQVALITGASGGIGSAIAWSRSLFLGAVKPRIRQLRGSRG